MKITINEDLWFTILFLGYTILIFIVGFKFGYINEQKNHTNDKKIVNLEIKK